MKKNITIILFLLLALGFLRFNFMDASQGKRLTTHITNVTVEKEITVNINGIQKSFSQKPFIINGSTIVPIRELSEALGATVSWEGNTQTVTILKNDITISLQIGKETAYVNEQKYILNVSPQLLNNTTIAPLRFVSESLGAGIEWNGETYSIDIHTEATETITPEKPERAENSNEVKQFEPFEIFYLYDMDNDTLKYITEDKFTEKFDDMSEDDLNKEYVSFKRFEDGSYKALIYTLVNKNSKNKMLVAQTSGNIVDNQYVGDCLLTVMVVLQKRQIGYEATYNFSYKMPVLENEKRLNFSPYIPSE